MTLAHDLELVFAEPLSVAAEGMVSDAVTRFVDGRGWELADTISFVEDEESGLERMKLQVETPDSERQIGQTVLAGSRADYRVHTPTSERSNPGVNRVRWARAYSNSVAGAEEIPDNLDETDYRELQDLAKSHGIKATQSGEEIEDALREVRA